MKADTQEWVSYAEEDYAVASILIRRRKNPVFNTVGFHCQQCVEKYLKARAIEAGQPVMKTHDLVTLLKKLLPVEPLWSAFLSTAKHLTSYAVEFRYPGHVSTKRDAQVALRDCRAIRKEVRASLRLPAR